MASRLGAQTRRTFEQRLCLDAGVAQILWIRSERREVDGLPVRAVMHVRGGLDILTVHHFLHEGEVASVRRGSHGIKGALQRTDDHGALPGLEVQEAAMIVQKKAEAFSVRQPQRKVGPGVFGREQDAFLPIRVHASNLRVVSFPVKDKGNARADRRPARTMPFAEGL